MTEAQFQKRILDLCAWLGLLAYHVYDSRRSTPGYPDLTIVGPGGLVFAELKTDKGKVSPEQWKWLEAIDDARIPVFVWRPADWPEVQNVLKGLARTNQTRPPIQIVSNLQSNS